MFPVLFVKFLGGPEFGLIRHVREIRYASPYDEPYISKYDKKQSSYPAAQYPSVQCPQNLLISCKPQVSSVPCQSPPRYNQNNY